MWVLRILLGLIKGVVVGGALGLAFFKLGIKASALMWILYGTIGALTGFVAGKAIWKQETIWTTVLKATFGFGVGCGLYALGAKVLYGVPVPLPEISALGLSDGQTHSLTYYSWLFGPLVGAIYGIFVELDDGGDDDKNKAATKQQPKSAKAPAKAEKPVA